VVTLDLRAGDLIVVDNRRVLHGRTWFDDSRRLLLRVRLWRRP
jgi:alpha-ketoglutarate-dependent taurine dioxygenase